MGRRVWIVKTLNTKARKDAIANNCPEMCVGIPPRLIGKVGDLPCVFEEPEPIQGPEPRDLEAEIDELRAEIEELRNPNR